MFSSQNSQISSAANYIEDVFSTYLYTGNGSTQTITNGIDLAGKGGMVWTKSRSLGTTTGSHTIYDTKRGFISPSNAYFLETVNTGAQGTNGSTLTSFNSDGFSLGTAQNSNYSGSLQASWTFRKQPKFFDVVTYTGDGTTDRQVPHNLGSTPGCVIVKSTSVTGNWYVMFRNITNNNSYLQLNSTSAVTSVTDFWSTAGGERASTYFKVSNAAVNASGQTYVAYLFAHDAGGFGLTGTDNVISCGSFTTDGTGISSVNLGYEPQFVLYKTSTSVGDWVMADNIRQLIRPTSGTDDSISKLASNLSSAEVASLGIRPTSTGFDTDNSSFASKTFIYIAIRRGPMKIPTTGTSVFSPTAYTATNVDNRLVDTGITTDMVMARNLPGTSTGGFYTADRLRSDYSLGTALTSAEVLDSDSFMTPTLGYGNSFSSMVGFGCGNDITRRLNYSDLAEIAYAFRRAPSFFDEVCYTGTGSATTQAHNLGVVPEMIIVKKRAGGTAASWSVYASAVGNTKWLVLNGDLAPITDTGAWNNTSPTSSVFTVGVNGEVNTLSSTYVAYLFATCPGVSKVGSYTGTGTTKQIDCGFTGGARFVLIKRTDSTGDWYVWDSARGIVAGNDPYLLLNSTAAEVTNTDYVDTYSAGFEISSTAPAAINASGGSYIFLAVS